jgi:hypothetical protein
MQSKVFLELGENACAVVVSLAFKFGDQLALPSYVLLALTDVLFRLG